MIAPLSPTRLDMIRAAIALNPTCEGQDAPAYRDRAELLAEVDRLRAALPFFGHQDGCGMREWSDEKDYIRTWFGFVITGETCDCGAIAVALALDADAAKCMAEEA